MNLRAYLDALPRGGIAAFAKKLEISDVYLQQLAARQGDREPKPELCVSIERESGMAVRRWDLRPDDWARIWPELVKAKGAPPVPAAEQEGA